MKVKALRRAGSVFKKIGKLITIATIVEAALIGFIIIAAFIVIVAAL